MSKSEKKKIVGNFKSFENVCVRQRGAPSYIAVTFISRINRRICSIWTFLSNLYFEWPCSPFRPISCWLEWSKDVQVAWVEVEVSS